MSVTTANPRPAPEQAPTATVTGAVPCRMVTVTVKASKAGAKVVFKPPGIKAVYKEGAQRPKPTRKTKARMPPIVLEVEARLRVAAKAASKAAAKAKRARRAANVRALLRRVLAAVTFCRVLRPSPPAAEPAAVEPADDDDEFGLALLFAESAADNADFSLPWLFDVAEEKEDDFCLTLLFAETEADDADFGLAWLFAETEADDADLGLAWLFAETEADDAGFGLARLFGDDGAADASTDFGLKWLFAEADVPMAATSAMNSQSTGWATILVFFVLVLLANCVVLALAAKPTDIADLRLHSSFGGCLGQRKQAILARPCCLTRHEHELAGGRGAQHFGPPLTTPAVPRPFPSLACIVHPLFDTEHVHLLCIEALRLMAAIVNGLLWSNNQACL